MNSLLICGLQVTLVAFVGCLTSLVLRRWLRTSAALPITATLGAIVLLTMCAYNSWPSWLLNPGESRGAAIPGGVSGSAPRLLKDPVLAEYTEVMVSTPLGDVDVPRWTWPLLYGTPATSSSQMDLDSPPSVWNWARQHWIVVLFIAGLTYGVVRVLGGLWAIHHFVRTSRPLTMPSLMEQVDLLCAQLGCRSTVEIRECKHLATAATVGWRKPVILLSETWRSWNETQLRSVLAHEIAHITRGDFLTGVAAQLGVVLHFYHPLVHWLANRLRLEQELAADELAAGVVGGSRAYLNAIGELALKQSNETLGWPAQAFLPTRSTFLRRIEMLRDLKLLSGKAPLAIRAGTLGAIAAVTLLAIGLRPPGGEGAAPTPAVAAEKPVGGLSGGQQAVKPLEAKYVPQNAGVVMVVRPGEVIRTLEKLVPSLARSLPDFGVGECEQASVFFLTENHGVSGQGVCLTYADKAARDHYLAAAGFKADDVTKKTFLTFEYEAKSPSGGQPTCCYKPDDLTVVLGAEMIVQQAMLSGPKSLSPLPETAAWKAAANGAAVLAIDPVAIKTMMATAPPNPLLGMFSPLWESASSHTLGLSLDQKTSLTLTSVAIEEVNAEKIKTTLVAGVTMLTNLANGLKQNPDPAMSKMASEDLLPMLAAHQLTLTGKEVTLRVSCDTEKLASMLVIPLTAAREEAFQSQQNNSLKQIMLAMHNYHDVHNHFPPAVVIDQASGVPRSWRVELLPLLDKQKLYDQYKKNEPWDSEANLKVLAQMPSVYKDPADTVDTTNTAVTAAYGKNLAFEEGDKEGRKIPDFTDGLSNTIAVIATKTEIPWTKPEDIKIDVTQDKLPQLGSAEAGYLFGMSDGSVLRVPGNVDVKVLKIALTRNDGEFFPGF